MSIITFGEEDAKILSWVAAGAENSDPGGVLIIDIDSSGTARISTNTAAFIRQMEVSVDDATDEKVAIRAKTLSSVASKVEEGMNLSITTNGDTVVASCGATSLSLTNLYDHVMDITRRLDRTKVASLTAGEFVTALAKAGTASAKGDVHVSFDNDGLVTVGARNGTIHTQELYPATIHEKDMEPSRILGSHVKPLKPLAKIEAVTDLDISLGHGYIVFGFPVSSAEANTKSVSMATPTVVSGSPVEGSPCDEEISPVLVIDRTMLKNALDPLSGAVPGDAIVTLDSSQVGRVTVSVSSDEGTGKTTILEAEVDQKKKINVTLGNVQTALKSISEREIQIGEVELDGQLWMTVTPVDQDSDDEDEDYTDGDIVIALLCD